MNQVDEGESPAGAQVVELLPAGRYLILFGADPQDAPDADELGDLRYQARKEARTPMLGLGLNEAYAVQTAISAVVSGVISPAVWASVPAAKRWIERTIRRRRERAALEAASAQAPGLPPTPAPVPASVPAQPAVTRDPVADADAILRGILKDHVALREVKLVGVEGNGQMWTVEMNADNRWTAVVRLAVDGSLADVVIKAKARR